MPFVDPLSPGLDGIGWPSGPVSPVVDTLSEGPEDGGDYSDPLLGVDDELFKKHLSFVAPKAFCCYSLVCMLMVVLVSCLVYYSVLASCLVYYSVLVD